MQIRPETPSDHEAIETLTYRAFDGHPHHEPGAAPTEHLIINRLRDNGALHLSLVAEDETGIVGQITFSPVTVGAKAGHWFGLGPVAVKPERQGEGIGGQLIREGLARLKAQGAQGVVLMGEPDYYGRFGFKPHPDLTYPGVPAEYFMALALNEAGEIPAGEVAYDPAFG